MAKRILTTLNIVTLNSDPSSGTPGEIYFNSTLGVLRYFNGVEWITAGESINDQYVVYSPEPPASPFIGQVWVESDLDILSGGAGIDIDGGSPSSIYSVTYDGGSPSTTSTTLTLDGGSA